MADSSITKAALGSALKKLVTEKPFEKTSIGEICELCNMNRKSFYYHFRDKYELVIWIFDTEFRKGVNDCEPRDLWEGVTSLSEYFYKNKPFYEKILLVNGQNCFTEYFSEFCKRNFKKIISESFGSTTINEKTSETYANFFVYALSAWITNDDGRDAKDFVKDLKDSVIFGAKLARVTAPIDE